MEANLDYLNKYSNNKKYFHFLLSKISDYAQNSSNPIKYLKTNIDNIKRKYPNSFLFILWDENGKIVKEASDKASYSYVANKVYECLDEVTKAVRINPSVKIANIELIRKNINILNNFFGNIFIAENLKKPISRGIDSSPLLTDFGGDYSFAWFSINKKVSFLCFISSELLNNSFCLKKISRVLNQNTDIVYGFSKSPDYEKPASDFPSEFESEITLALSIFENGGDSCFENNKALVKMAMPQPDVITYCYFHKKSDIWNYEDKRNIGVSFLSLVLLSFYVFVGFWFLYKHHFFSIGWKLTSLFLIANLVPICFLAYVTKKYNTNKKFSLNNEIAEDLTRVMRNFDLEYNYAFEKYSLKLNSKVDVISKKIGNDFIKENEKKEISDLFYYVNPTSVYLIASSGEMIISKNSEDKSNNSFNFMSTFGKSSLDFLNHKQVESDNNDIFSDVFTPELSDFYKSFLLKNIGNINLLFFGNIKQVYYFYTFGEKEIFNNNYLLVFSWNNEEFQNIFLKENFNNLLKSYPEAVFCIKSNLEKTFYGPHWLEPYLNSVLEKKSEITEKITGNIEIEGKKYFYVCQTGTNLDNWTMMAIYPDELINKSLSYYIIQVLIGALISLIFTIIIGQLLSFQFLKPIQNIGKAVKAIGEHNFSYHVPIFDKDEFGRLNQVFNRVIDGLGDFEVAKIVQESLLPGNHFSVGDFDIFAKTVVMTTLGGDYYDCFKINSDYLGIIIGDVAGHGIPAGLMMAMAKSAVLSASEEIKIDPSALTTMLHKMFYSIKNKRLKRMMTFQYFVLNINNGHFIYTNAGHCFPVIVDNNTKKAIYMDYASNPLGITSKCRCSNQEFDLAKGQSLILYTDGIVEANNSNKEQFGYERFLNCLPKNYDINPENYYYNLYNKVYKKWILDIDDDLSLILINRK
jgi:hypothetical protein